MARIALCVDHWNESVEALVWGLHQQRQELLVITGQDQSAKLSSQLRNAVQVITPFRNWGVFEVARALQPIINFQPDIWHFVFTSQDSRPRAAHWALAAVVRTLPRKVLVASLLNDRLWNGKGSGMDRSHLKLFDAITFSTRMQLMKMKREGGLPKHCLAEILLPTPTEQSSLHLPVRSEVLEMREHLRPYVIVLGGKSSTFEPIAQLVPETRLLIVGPRDVRADTLHFAPDLNASELDTLSESASALMVAFGDFSVEELRLYWSQSERWSKPLIVNPDQVERVPGLCIDGKTGWVLHQGIKSLRELLLENPNLLLKREASLTRHEFSDYSLNQLVRLYHRAFEKRWA